MTLISASSIPPGPLVARLKKCTMMADQYSRQIIVNNLRFGSTISEPERPDVQVTHIVEACLDYSFGVEELIDVMVNFEESSEGLQNVCALLDQVYNAKQLPFVSWSQVLQLKKIIEEAYIADDNAIAALERTYFNNMSSIKYKFNPKFRYYIDWLAQQPHKAPAQAPLLTFLHKCRPLLESDVNLGDLDRWIEDVANDLNIDLSAMQLRATESEEVQDMVLPVLQIKIEPSIEPDERADRFLVQAWPYGEPNTRPLCAELEQRTIFTAKELPELIGHIVHGYDEYLPEGFDFFTIELVLPLALLNCDVGSWMYPDAHAPYPLTALHTVLVRPWERHYNPPANTHRLWRAKWSRLPFHPAQVSEEQVFWACTRDELPANLPDVLRGRDLIPVIAELLPASGATKVSRTLKDIVYTGLPIALWFRDCIDNTTYVREQISSLLYDKPLNDFPELLRQKRKLTHAEPEPSNEVFFTFWNKITLLWDDPERMPHDAAHGPKANLTARDL